MPTNSNLTGRVLVVFAFFFMAAQTAAAMQAAVKVIISPSNMDVGAGQTRSLSIKSESGQKVTGGTCTQSPAIPNLGRIITENGTAEALEIKAPGAAEDKISFTGVVSISCKGFNVAGATTVADPADLSVYLTPAIGTPRRGGDIATVLLGFEQVGGPSTDSDQKYFLDFFISRPLRGFNSRSTNTEDRLAFGPKLRWWGSLRMSSAPQQVTTEVAKFATEFTTNVG